MDSRSIFSFMGWSFLPSFGTSLLQSLYYSVTIRAGDPKPAPGSALHSTHRRRLMFLVISSYLCFTVYEAYWEVRQAGSFFDVLGVSADASDREVKTRFRRLAALYHPDKITGGSSLPRSLPPGVTSKVSLAEYFLHLKTASETLTSSPTLRFAYERFGPAVLRWKACVSVWDYLRKGAMEIMAPYYVSAAVFTYIAPVLGYFQSASYWRWTLLVCLCITEFILITRPSPSDLLSSHTANQAVFSTGTLSVSSLLDVSVMRLFGLPPLLPFQIITMARKLCLTLYLALTHLGPLVLGEESRTQQDSSGPNEHAVHAALDDLDLSIRSLHTDTSRLLALQFAPFRPRTAHTPQRSDPRDAADVDQDVVWDRVQERIQQALVQNTLQSDPLVRDALQNVLRGKS